MTMFAPITKLADILISHNVPVYMYMFEHEYINSMEQWWGSFHSLELDYVFGSPFTGFNIGLDDWANHTELDKNMSRRTMQGWANFAKHGWVYRLINGFDSVYSSINHRLPSNNVLIHVQYNCNAVYFNNILYIHAVSHHSRTERNHGLNTTWSTTATHTYRHTQWKPNITSAPTTQRSGIRWSRPCCRRHH